MLPGESSPEKRHSREVCAEKTGRSRVAQERVLYVEGSRLYEEKSH